MQATAPEPGSEGERGAEQQTGGRQRDGARIDAHVVEVDLRGERRRSADPDTQRLAE